MTHKSDTDDIMKACETICITIDKFKADHPEANIFIRYSPICNSFSIGMHKSASDVFEWDDLSPYDQTPEKVYDFLTNMLYKLESD